VAAVTSLATLASATEALKKSNDALEQNRRDRGSVPPSAPRQVAPIVITAERARDIARALKNNHTILTLVSLIDIEPGLTPAEFQAFADLAVRGAK